MKYKFVIIESNSGTEHYIRVDRVISIIGFDNGSSVCIEGWDENLESHEAAHEIRDRIEEMSD